MLKYHVRTDGNGYTEWSLSEDKKRLDLSMDKGLKPNTDYTVTIEEGKPVRYPRYFVPNWPHSSYLRFDSPNTFPVAIGDDGIGDPVLRKLQDVEKDDGYREVSYEEAEAHIRRDDKTCSECKTLLTEDERDSNGGVCHECNEKTELETCVWRKFADEAYEPGCQKEPLIGGALLKYFNNCPYCGSIIKCKKSELEIPDIPSGYRVPEQWELDMAHKSGTMPPDMYALYDSKWHHTSEDFWPVEVEKYAVPADWNPQLPDNYRVMEDWEVEVAAELGLDKPETFFFWTGKQWIWGNVQTPWDTIFRYAAPSDFSVMPKCCDDGCDGRTGLNKSRFGFYVTCFNNNDTYLPHTCGPVRKTKAKAIIDYPRKEG